MRQFIVRKIEKLAKEAQVLRRQSGQTPPLTALGNSRHCRGGKKLAFVRFTPLATIFGVGPIGR